MKNYTIQKIDTNLYIKGFSGRLVYSALYGIIGALLLFVLLYILAGTFIAVLVCVPLFFAWLYRLNRIQKKYGHAGWGKKKISRQLPEFITIKKRFLR
ncbi:DUF4133 domain-containing protein [Maribellus maritimus]|uniref:DUF4133 domain-containing protein n=1 Tax=Maribellus maritimus TaxID=2870838 RepID=UPI001EEB6BCA|nr:DUF4133 domain-containing protein [Maribellus maritimus]MCG6190848.1 DUF4133 domain-containing protein [Maribellus maritimus]